MAPGYEDFYNDFSAALATGRKPKFPQGQDLSKTVPASANKHVLANAALALSTPSAAVDVLEWLEWYAFRPLHENEETTASESYRPAIDFPTLALAGYAGDQGRKVLQEALLNRARASICDLLLSLGCAPPRTIRDEGTPGKRGIQVGDGGANPLAGNSSMPVIVGVGKRGYVRADTPQGNLGPWHYLYQEIQAVMVCQALSMPYAAKPFKRQHGDFESILRRWPSMRRWGFSPDDLATAKAYLDNPADPALALKVHLWAAMFPSNEGRLRVRGTDKAIESIALNLGHSSTGGVAINCQRADGVTFRTSSDTGTRFKTDIKAQTAEIAGNRLRCVWTDHPDSEMSVDRVVTKEAWRSVITAAGSDFSEGGHMPTPIPPQPGPSPQPPTTEGSLVYLGQAGPGESVYGSKNPKMTVREIHGEGEWKRRWIAEEK